MEFVVQTKNKVVSTVFSLFGGHSTAPEVVFALVLVVVLLIVWIVMRRGPIGWVLNKVGVQAKCGSVDNFANNPLAPGAISRYLVPERTDTGSSERTDRFQNMGTKGISQPTTSDMALAQSTFDADRLSSGVFSGGATSFGGWNSRVQAVQNDGSENMSNYSDAALLANNFGGLGINASH